ncbi:MAG: DUF3108 domain-containing protein [Gemmobacter sp.]
MTAASATRRHALRRGVALVLALCLVAPLPDPVLSAPQGQFDFVLRGIRAGTLQWQAVEQNGQYAVSGRLESAGLAGMVRRVRFDARAQGRVNGERLLPLRYEENSDTGRRQSEAVMVWRGGVPQVELVRPEREPGANDLDPADQRGTVDPLTALYATLRDVPAERACSSSVQMFDGRRRSALTLGAPRQEGDRIACTGEYRRIAGFSDKEMAERTRFPFTLTYAPNGDGTMRVIEVAMDTIYGKAYLKRR